MSLAVSFLWLYLFGGPSDTGWFAGPGLLRPRPVVPVLAFPEPGLDDTAAYQGYRTRFYRDSKNNTVQIYIQPRDSRVVLVWADAANESAGFTVRDAAGRPAALAWNGDAADIADSAGLRALTFRLTANSSRIEVGWFLLGSMRVERDFVYAKRNLAPFTASPFRVAEESLLVSGLARLPPEERSHHLTLLKAASAAELEKRLLPALGSRHTDTISSVTVERPSLDGRNRLGLELMADPRKVKTTVRRGTVSFQTRPGSPVQLTVRVVTDAAPLTPLSRRQIFNRQFLDYLARARGRRDSAAALHYRRLERQVRGVELLSSEEKLMAGLPNFATYFGRDMMMTALMMRPIWSADMAEHVIASVLRKLGPGGEVSHEEALGGQAIRENAVVYDSLVGQYWGAARQGRPRSGDSALSRSREILQDLQKTRENYHMIDDEFQLPVLAARYLADSNLSADRKRGFLLGESDSGVSRLQLLLREMALVASMTRPYVDDPRPLNLVSFPRRDATHWRSASWRDSDAGYAGGRFAMDVNAIWAPQALKAIATILRTLPTMGLTPGEGDAWAAGAGNTPLGDYLRTPESLQRAIEIWQGARRHFEVTLPSEEAQRRSQRKLAWLPPNERRYWRMIMSQHPTGGPFTFLVLSLDAGGRPIPVVNTDPATGFFLDRVGKDVMLQDLGPFVQPYPFGLLVEGLGPLVANDTYAPRTIWERFQADQYHGPRVVWGREVNLLFLGIANQIAEAFDGAGKLKDPTLEPQVRDLGSALRRTLQAVAASGLGHNELWSYRIEGARLVPTRYGTSSDVQLWNTTDLAVEFVLSSLPTLSP